jgi:cystathionine beta-lyase
LALKSALTATTRLFLLCHPHNPVGRCWSRDELLDLATFAEENDLVVCSDEIHCGLILDRDKRHIPFASLSPDAAKRSITLMAPSKTYNIPGLGCAFAVIPDAGLRQIFEYAMHGIVPHVNVLGLAACEAAYRDSDDWHDELITYFVANRDQVFVAVNAEKGVKMSRVEATYLPGSMCVNWVLRQPRRVLRGTWSGPVGWQADFWRAGLVKAQLWLCPQHLDEALQAAFSKPAAAA